MAQMRHAGSEPPRADGEQGESGPRAVEWTATRSLESGPWGLCGFVWRFSPVVEVSWCRDAHPEAQGGVPVPK